MVVGRRSDLFLYTPFVRIARLLAGLHLLDRVVPMRFGGVLKILSGHYRRRIFGDPVLAGGHRHALDRSPFGPRLHS